VGERRQFAAPVRTLAGVEVARERLKLGLADVDGSASVSVIVGAALVLAPLLASLADQRRDGRRAC
jgi:hypothetical protein